MPRKLTPKLAKKKCDVLFSQIIRAYGRCEFCETTRNLQCAHVIVRDYAHTRTDEFNAFCLCAGHHMHFHAHPDDWMRFVDERIGREEYDRLKRKAFEGIGVKFDWFAELERLKELHSRLVNA